MSEALRDGGRAQVASASSRCCAGIDLALAEHEVVCLIGASGSGKSTLLRCVNLLEPIDAGRIVVGGDEITAPRRRREPRAARDRDRLPGVQPLPAHDRARERDARPAQGARAARRREADAEATALLARFGLADKRDEYPDRLSGGQQQRVAIVRALAMQPQLLLLDEVTSALDPELVAEVLDVIRELAAGGMTMLIATHEMGFARDIARPRLLPRRGRILEEGPPERDLHRAARGADAAVPPADRRRGTAVARLARYRSSMRAGLAAASTSSLEPLDEYLVIQPSSDETETRAGLILPASAAAAARVPHRHRHRGRLRVTGIEPGDKVLYPREAGYEVRLGGIEVKVAQARRADRPRARLSATVAAGPRRADILLPTRRSGRVAEGGALLRR